MFVVCLNFLHGDFYKEFVFPVPSFASEGGIGGGGLAVLAGFGLGSCLPFADNHMLNSSSIVISDGLMFCIGTILTSETASCH